ncbi:pantoate--beta-alanine ligase [Paenibacillus larvae]|uniref:Pantothenate synthetase n=3 Tax=Paenibacillus larvae TaxID=1464 RepID=V9W2I2_9BACL|nr:pantoate--beta-alanine ligase [Paenibacillus larvae]AHD05226.1 pantothenate ligase PanC [Paenibacillus larvae subsp. larvae DSM 25430]AQR79469.1 pantoate--beta-alanine ligase [Paenibacillus larvae subsp. larvae]AVF23346.1 pantothenate ligase PanC [Paenibacillus larvae subsp. larvae]AVG11771.1 pantothenate ligase PanC [Paenibacillus larvae subsp. larvae DSM 25430]ETK25969.1 pantothenate ligase PanC [Paenibacillus larvae subsp. larvae DSM 25719]
MKVITRIAELKQAIWELKTGHNRFHLAPVGFVPTMGYLHEGHLSLVEEAKKQCFIVIMSIFVNPLQFGQNEDLDQYPRDIERDKQLASEAGVDLLFLPTVEEMYPRSQRTTVHISELTNVLCGASRPDHFDGVTTVVSKLFHIVQPDKAFFGLKDAQQVAVIEQMVEDLNMNVEIVPCPIVREKDGLAKSSRNVYLSPEERKQALVLSAALNDTLTWLSEQKEFNTQEVRQRLVDQISSQPLADIDYVEVLSYPSLKPLPERLTLSNNVDERIIFALAVRFGGTRLIDNAIFHWGEISHV